MDPLNFSSQKQTKNISVVLPSSPIKIWGKSVKRFLSYDRTCIKTFRLIDVHTDILTYLFKVKIRMEIMNFEEHVFILHRARVYTAPSTCVYTAPTSKKLNQLKSTVGISLILIFHSYAFKGTVNNVYRHCTVYTVKKQFFKGVKCYTENSFNPIKAGVLDLCIDWGGGRL